VTSHIETYLSYALTRDLISGTQKARISPRVDNRSARSTVSSNAKRGNGGNWNSYVWKTVRRHSKKYALCVETDKTCGITHRCAKSERAVLRSRALRFAAEARMREVYFHARSEKESENRAFLSSNRFEGAPFPK